MSFTSGVSFTTFSMYWASFRAFLTSLLIGTSLPAASMEYVSPFMIVTTSTCLPWMVRCSVSFTLSGSMEATSWVNSTSPTPGKVILPLLLAWTALYFVRASSPPWALIALLTTATASSMRGFRGGRGDQ